MKEVNAELEYLKRIEESGENIIAEDFFDAMKQITILEKQLKTSNRKAERWKGEAQRWHDAYLDKVVENDKLRKDIDKYKELHDMAL